MDHAKSLWIGQSTMHCHKGWNLGHTPVHAWAVCWAMHVGLGCTRAGPTLACYGAWSRSCTGLLPGRNKVLNLTNSWFPFAWFNNLNQKILLLLEPRIKMTIKFLHWYWWHYFDIGDTKQIRQLAQVENLKEKSLNFDQIFLWSRYLGR